MATASPDSKTFAIDLLFERGFDGFPVEDLDGMDQRTVSALIQDLLARPSVAATQEQIDEIASLAAQLPKSDGTLGRTVVAGATRAACRRQIKNLRTELNSRTWKANVDEAHSLLDSWAADNGVQIA